MKTKLLLFSFALCILNFESAQSANYYWVGGTGNWSNYSVHWATTSGGNVFYTHVPTSFDNVYFDANSFTAPGQIVTNDTTIAYCRDMDWTGATNNPTFEAANTSIELKIFGSLTLNPVVNFSFNGNLTFTSFNPGKTIQTFSRVLQCPIEFNGAGGEWTMLDSLTTTKDITLTYGTLRTNDNDMSCRSFYSNGSGARAIYLGASSVFINGAFNNDGFWNVSSSLAIDADSSIISMKDGAQFHSDGLNYNIVQWNGGSSSFSSSTFWNSNSIVNKVFSFPSTELLLQQNLQVHVDTLICNGMLEVHYGGQNFYNYLWVNSNVHTYNAADSIMKMIVGGNIILDNSTHFVHDLTVGGNLSINQSSPQVFDFCTVYGNATILSANNQLGIFTMTPGKTLTLKNDSTQYIDSLSATGNPGFPIQIISSDLGLAANVVIDKDLCTDYLYIQAVHATSPNFLFVGTNSNDVANNSGWIFNNCITGMKNNYDASLSVFPNPATNQFTIYDERFTISNVEVYNLFGEKILSQKFNNQKLTVNVSSFAPGVYFVKVKGEQQEYVAKFAKE
jgi:hypothetical protein